jgi:hypothetical protein
MFNNSKYTSWYYEIIANAKKASRKKGGEVYYENHHVIPGCEPFNGSNRKENMVLLTGREHFLVHWLLTKMCDGVYKQKMQHAILRMTTKTGKRIVTSWQYEIAKREHAIAVSSRKVTSETRAKLSESLKGKNVGKVYTEEHKANLRKAAKKRGPVSEETRQKRSKSLKGRIAPNKGKPSKMKGKSSGLRHTEEHKKKMSEMQKGRVFDDEHRRRISEAQKKRHAARKAMTALKEIPQHFLTSF